LNQTGIAMLAIRKRSNGRKSFIGSWFLIDTTAFNREAVTPQSPGLFQPWEYRSSFPTRNGLRDGRNRFAVSTLNLTPRVAETATLGFAM
jgi:hypothetical protein